jgi:uncharacterized protein YjdB
MEALTIELQGAPAGTRVCYQAHIESIGWNQGEVCDGALVGTVGQSLRIEAVRIRIINPTSSSAAGHRHRHDVSSARAGSRMVEPGA